MPDNLKNRQFWLQAGTLLATLTCLGALAKAAPLLYQTKAGRIPAIWIGIMGSREVLDNAGVRGYYEKLLGKFGRMDKHYEYDHSFHIFRFKPNLTWEHDLVTTNSYGLVGPECSLQKASGSRRVALFGSSLSAGHMVKANQTFGALLEDRLNTATPIGPYHHFEVLNIACISYTLPQMLDIAAEDAPRFHTDVYLVALDELSVSTEWARHLVQITEQGIDPKYPFLRDILHQAKVSKQDSADTLYGKLAPYRIPVLRRLLQEFKNTARLHNASLIIALVPSVEAGDLSRRRMSSIRPELDSLGVPIVDLLDTFAVNLNPAPFAVYPGDVHPNARGHALIFENLYKGLQAQPQAWAALAGED